MFTDSTPVSNQAEGAGNSKLKQNRAKGPEGATGGSGEKEVKRRKV